MTALKNTPLPPVLSIGQVSERSGIPVSTLHFYESIGLIQSWRNQGNQRRYDRHILRRLAIIKVAQRTGIPLDTIGKALAALPADKKITKAVWKKLSGDWQKELDTRITALTRLRDELNQCIGCGCLSLADCPLRNPDDVLAKKGSGAYLLERPAQKKAET